MKKFPRQSFDQLRLDAHTAFKGKINYAFCMKNLFFETSLCNVAFVSPLCTVMCMVVTYWVSLSYRKCTRRWASITYGRQPMLTSPADEPF
jgi:hypothetical protein